SLYLRLGMRFDLDESDLSGHSVEKSPQDVLHVLLLFSHPPNKNSQREWQNPKPPRRQRPQESCDDQFGCRHRPEDTLREEAPARPEAAADHLFAGCDHFGCCEQLPMAPAIAINFDVEIVPTRIRFVGPALSIELFDNRRYKINSVQGLFIP